MMEYDSWISEINMILLSYSNLTTDSLELPYYDLYSAGKNASQVAQSILDVKLGRRAPNILGG